MKTTLNKTLATSYIRSHNAAVGWLNRAVPPLIEYLYENPNAIDTEPRIHDILESNSPYYRGLHARFTASDGKRYLTITNKGHDSINVLIAQPKLDGYPRYDRRAKLQVRDFNILLRRIHKHKTKAQHYRALTRTHTQALQPLRQLHTTLIEKGILIEEKEKEQISVDTLQTPGYTSPNKAINETKERPLKRKRD